MATTLWGDLLTMQKLTVAQYARLMNASETTIRRRIKSGELSTEQVNGVTYIVLERLPIDSQGDSQLISQLQEQVERQQSEIDFLREELSKITEAYTQAQTDTESSKERSDTIILQLTQQVEQRAL
jgi:methyl-accepting chemotaxis protein